MFYRSEHFMCSYLFYLGFWFCLSRKGAKHERIVNVKNVVKKVVPSALKVKKICVDRHVEDHGHERECGPSLRLRKDMITKMKQAYAFKVGSMPVPSYNVTPAEVQFLYHFGQLALKTRQNPIHFMHFDHRTIKNDLSDMAGSLMKHLDSLVEKDITKHKSLDTLGRVISIRLVFKLIAQIDLIDIKLNINLKTFKLSFRS